jgi:hypothetical protein
MFGICGMLNAKNQPKERFSGKTRASEMEQMIWSHVG